GPPSRWAGARPRGERPPERAFEKHGREAGRPVECVFTIRLRGFASGTDGLAFANRNELDPSLPHAVGHFVPAGARGVAAAVFVRHRGIEFEEYFRHDAPLQATPNARCPPFRCKMPTIQGCVGRADEADEYNARMVAMVRLASDRGTRCGAPPTGA